MSIVSEMNIQVIGNTPQVVHYMSVHSSDTIECLCLLFRCLGLFEKVSVFVSIDFMERVFFLIFKILYETLGEYKAPVAAGSPIIPFECKTGRGGSRTIQC